MWNVIQTQIGGSGWNFGPMCFVLLKKTIATEENDGHPAIFVEF